MNNVGQAWPASARNPERAFLAPMNDLTAHLGALARRAETSEALLQSSLQLVTQVTGARAIALFLCDTDAIELLDLSSERLRFVSEAVLFGVHGEPIIGIPARVEFDP